MIKRKDFRILSDIHGISLAEAKVVDFASGSTVGPKLESGRRYEIITLLGTGSLGCVYLVKDHKFSGQLYALKMILPQNLNTQEKIDRFILRVNKLHKLKHAGYLDMMDLWKQKKLYFFTMEYVEGLSLSEWIQQEKGIGKYISVLDVCDIVLQICDCLQFLHNFGGHGLLHTNNILINEERKIRIADFGLDCLYLPEYLEKISSFMGYENYLAPERDCIDVNLTLCDVHSLGALLFEMLTYEFFEESSRISSIRHDLMPGLDDIVAKATHINPSKRYASVEDFGAELRVFEDNVRHHKLRTMRYHKMKRSGKKKVHEASQILQAIAFKYQEQENEENEENEKVTGEIDKKDILSQLNLINVQDNNDELLSTKSLENKLPVNEIVADSLLSEENKDELFDSESLGSKLPVNEIVADSLLSEENVTGVEILSKDPRVEFDEQVDAISLEEKQKTRDSQGKNLGDVGPLKAIPANQEEYHVQDPDIITRRLQLNKLEQQPQPRSIEPTQLLENPKKNKLTRYFPSAEKPRKKLQLKEKLAPLPKKGLDDIAAERDAKIRLEQPTPALFDSDRVKDELSSQEFKVKNSPVETDSKSDRLTKYFSNEDKESSELVGAKKEALLEEVVERDPATDSQGLLEEMVESVSEFVIENQEISDSYQNSGIVIEREPDSQEDNGDEDQQLIKEVLEEGDQLAMDGLFEEAIYKWQQVAHLLEEVEMKDRFMQVIDMAAELAQEKIEEAKYSEAQNILDQVIEYNDDQFVEDLYRQILNKLDAVEENFQDALLQVDNHLKKKQYQASIDVLENMRDSYPHHELAIKEKLDEVTKLNKKLNSDEEEYLKLIYAAKVLEDKGNYQEALQTFEKIRQGSWSCPVTDVTKDIERVGKFAASIEPSNKANQILTNIENLISQGKWLKAKQAFKHSIFERKLLPKVEKRIEEKKEKIKLLESNYKKRKRQLSFLFFLFFLAISLWIYLWMA